MGRQVESSLSSFATWLRARRRGPAILVLLAWVVLAQTLLVVHRVDHNATANHSVSCALCVAADHLAGTVEAPTHVIEPPEAVSVPILLSESLTQAIRVSYRSRAPPRSS